MSDNNLPFEKGCWVIDRARPGVNGVFTGNVQKRGSRVSVEIEYGPRDRVWRPIQQIEPAIEDESSIDVTERIRRKRYGDISDLRKLLTFEKLRGTLHEIIYSMEAAQIDFYPYQFKPVLKFIESTTDRLLIADEVGLGKTIEAALIWLELQTRKNAKRLIVFCPTQILANKWRDELRDKFLIDARAVRFSDVQDELSELKRKGANYSFALVVTYSGMRPSRDDIRNIRDELSTTEPTVKQQFYKDLQEWEWEFNPFDLTIFDEAHHMRNPRTANNFLGTVISNVSASVLCVSATPVNNSNQDLHSLLKLIDDEFFSSQVTFQDLLDSNTPTVRLINGLARVPVDVKMVKDGIKEMSRSRFVNGSSLFESLCKFVDKADWNNPVDIAYCQGVAERLNILGSYVTRTRRSQVKEHRPIREPVVLEVEFSDTEMRLYDAIIQIVRNRCKNLEKDFHIFQVIGLQMRAASSLPALASELKSGRLGEPHELLVESFGDFEDFYEINQEAVYDEKTIESLLEYDYESNDHKYLRLEEFILNNLRKEKVVIFSFYRGTLNYLFRRLSASGISIDLIHGGIKHEDRISIVDKFNSINGSQVLLTSEVGSEGIDMHENCRCLINYDLPWNPMRIEQRIGRIDRVGQKADKLSIVHFKVRNTIEERVYDRLHERLLMFANSLGDLESVIGKAVRELTIDLLRQDLSIEQEEEKIKSRERVIQQKLNDLQLLENSGDVLVGLSDYIQKKINEGRGRGRYIQPRELERYVVDFFKDNWSGTEVIGGTPKEHCLSIRLSMDARNSLDQFIQDDRSLAAGSVRRTQIFLTFRKEVYQRLSKGEKKEIHYANHLSPLVRWITQCYRNNYGKFYDLSVMKLKSQKFPQGVWCYRVERWFLKGIRNEERLVYSLVQLDTQESMDANVSEEIFQMALSEADYWDYPNISFNQAECCLAIAEQNLSRWFDDAYNGFEAENQHACQIRKERAANLFDRRIRTINQTLNTLRERNRGERMISLQKAKLVKTEENKADKLSKFDAAAIVDMEKSVVAVGFICIEN